jgi:hypothetical protein
VSLCGTTRQWQYYTYRQLHPAGGYRLGVFVPATCSAEVPGRAAGGCALLGVSGLQLVVSQSVSLRALFFTRVLFSPWQ